MYALAGAPVVLGPVREVGEYKLHCGKISGTSKGASPFKLSGKLNESLVEVDAKSVHFLPSKGRRISVFMTLLGYI